MCRSGKRSEVICSNCVIDEDRLHSELHSVATSKVYTCLIRSVHNRHNSQSSSNQSSNPGVVCSNQHRASRRHYSHSTNVNYLFQAAILGVLSLTCTMSAPLYQNDDVTDGGSSSAAAMLHATGGTKPRWINPCGLSGHMFDPDSDPQSMHNVPVNTLLDEVIKRARDATRQAKHVKEEFLNQTLTDSKFEDSVKDIKGQKWLPDIPENPDFSEMEQNDAFKSSYEMLQYFAVGIQQIVLDETLNEGHFVELFLQTQNYLTAVLCELQMGMYLLRIKPNPDVLDAVMSQEYRDTDDRSIRRMRDYFIIRDYIKAVEYVADLFTYLKDNLNKQ